MLSHATAAGTVYECTYQVKESVEEGRACFLNRAFDRACDLFRCARRALLPLGCPIDSSPRSSGPSASHSQTEGDRSICFRSAETR